MQTLLPYLIKTIVCAAIFTACYWLALRNKHFHTYNRFYLLLSFAGSLLLPLVKFQLPSTGIRSKLLQAVELPVFQQQPGELPVVMVKTEHVVDWQGWLFAGVLLFSSILLMVLCRRIASIYRLTRKYPAMNMGNILFINTDIPQAPFSFLNKLFWRNDLSYEDETGKQILQHELTHIHQKHTIDKLFVEIVLCICWMNPFLWLLRKELWMVHEFIADEHAIANKDSASFAKMLLRQQYGKHAFSPAQAFNHSPIKRRLFMLNLSKKTSLPGLKKWATLPLALLLALAFSTQTEGQNSTKKDKKEDAKVSSVTVEDVLQGSNTEENEIVVVGFAPDNYEPEKRQPLNIPGVKAAEFPGGRQAWLEYLGKNLNSEVTLTNKAPLGRYKVVVSFGIDKDGKVYSAKAETDPGYGTAAEAERVIMKSPAWIPATDNGKKIKNMQKQMIIFEAKK